MSGGEAHIPQSLGTKGNREGWPSWVEYRSGVNGLPNVTLFHCNAAFFKENTRQD